MKEIDVSGIAGMQPVRGGTDSWYYVLDGTYGDLYEAQEIYGYRGEIGGSRFFLIRHPDGAVFRPLPAVPDTVAGEPVYHENRISFPAVPIFFISSTRKRIMLRSPRALPRMAISPSSLPMPIPQKPR